MSTPKSTNPLETSAPIRPTVSHRKPKVDMYTVLLVMSLIAVLLGILFLYLHMDHYDFKFKGGPIVMMTKEAEVGDQGRSEIVQLARAGQTSPLHAFAQSLIPHHQSLIEHGCSKTC